METTKRLYLMLGRDGYPIHRQGWELIETADLPFLDIDLNEVVHFEEWEETDDEFGNLIDSKIVAVYMSVEQLQLYLKVPYNVVKALIKYQIEFMPKNHCFVSNYNDDGIHFIIRDSWVDGITSPEIERLGLEYTWACCSFHCETGETHLVEVLE